MPPEQLLIKEFSKIISEAIASQIPALLLLVISFGVIGYALRFVIRNTFGRLIFQIDNYLSIGKRVRIRDGRIGDIKAVSIFSGVTIKTKDSYLTIPWEEWRGSYEILKYKEEK